MVPHGRRRRRAPLDFRRLFGVTNHSLRRRRVGNARNAGPGSRSAPRAPASSSRSWKSSPSGVLAALARVAGVRRRAAERLDVAGPDPLVARLRGYSPTVPSGHDGRPGLRRRAAAPGPARRRRPGPRAVQQPGRGRCLARWAMGSLGLARISGWDVGPRGDPPSGSCARERGTTPERNAVRCPRTVARVAPDAGPSGPWLLRAPEG